MTVWIRQRFRTAPLFMNKSVKPLYYRLIFVLVTALVGSIEDMGGSPHNMGEEQDAFFACKIPIA